METIKEPGEARAHKMHHLLTERGIDCVVHWDRSPWGVRVWLTHEDGPEYRTPSFFLLCEETHKSPHRSWCWIWTGSFGGFTESLDQTFTEFTIDFPEWGYDEDTQLNTVAEAVVAFLRLLIIQEVTPEEPEADHTPFQVHGGQR